jgi:hypothetical protein
VRCPHCGDQYPLQTAVEFAPPALEIIPAPALGAENESHGNETAAAAAAFESESIFAPSGDGADIADATAMEQTEKARVASSAQIEDHLADDDFAAAVSLSDEPSAADEDQPFLAEQEHAMDEAEHDTDEDFHFADEHGEGAVELGHETEHAHMVEGEHHPLGEIATMAATPPKKKRPVPMTVRLIGYGMFIASGLLGLVVVYAASLYFGFSDPLKLGKHLPEWLVAKSLRGEPDRSKPAANPDSLRQAVAGSDAQKQAAPGDADAGGGSKNPPSGDDKGTTKSDVADNGPATRPEPDGKTASKSTPADVASETAGKPNPDVSPFDKSPKPNDAEPSKDDAAKLDPPAGAPKLPDLDMPDAKIAKPSADKSPDKTPAAPSSEKALTTTVEKPLTKPADHETEKIAKPIALKSDKSYSLADLTAAVDAATQANAELADAVKAADEKAVTAGRRHNFKAMSHLATVLTFVKADAPNLAETIKRLKDQVAASLSASAAAVSEPERKAAGELAGIWIGYDKRTEPGIFGEGILKAVQNHDSLFESQVELPDGKTALTVVSTEKPAVEDGQPVVVLGAIVNDPAKNLPEYKGTADPVIFATLLVAPASGR